MKKTFLFTSMVAMLFAFGCSKEMDNPNADSNRGRGTHKVTIGASLELPDGVSTKSTLDSDGAFAWTDADRIWVNTTEGFEYLSWAREGADAASASFTGLISGNIISDGYGVFPVYCNGNTPLNMPQIEESEESNVIITLPSEIAWVAGVANNVMVGKISGGNLPFQNVGGMFMVTIGNMPDEARKITFTTGKRMSGEFTVTTDDKSYFVINTDDTTTDGVTFTFTSEQIASEMVFYVPAPIGEYSGLSFQVKDADNNVLASFNGSTSKTITRKKLIILPKLNFASVGGNGENGTGSLTIPANYTTDVNHGVFLLPSTTSDLEVLIYEESTVTIRYSEGEKPANVALIAQNAIETLNIELPESHVTLNGANTSSNVTINNVEATTSTSTFVVGAGIQIGSDQENPGLITIKGGSLELNAPVKGTVKVDIPEDNINTTDEKVRIVINNEINNLQVESAATQNNPDKVWVSINTHASVSQAITVPEVNCNLYIAAGANAKTVTTQAANTTIEGSVETLSASGEGTTVVVEKSGSVTESITSSEKATIVIEERTQTEIDNKEAGEIADQEHQTVDTGGTISTIADGSVALIGSEAYATLEAAVATASDDATIDIIKEGTYSIPAITKTITIDANVEGVVVNHAGQSAVTTITSGKTLTLKNIALNLDKSFYQGFGTSGTGANAGALVMENCSIDGSLSLFGVSTFNNCTFTAKDSNAGYYNIWAVYSNATFTGCSFTNTNRAVNVYDPACGAVRKTVTFENCSFTASEKKKAAINIHHNPTPVQASGAKFDVVITDCTTSGTWASSVADTGEPTDATVCDSALWMVSDIENWTNGDITVNGESVYEVSVAQIGDVKYATIEEAFAAVPVNTPTTITMIANANLGSEQITIASDKDITLELNGKTVSKNAAKNSSDALFCNRGTLTIQDNTDTQKDGTGTGKVSYWNGLPDPKDWPGYATNTITNNGTLTIKSGYVENITEGGYAAYTVDNQTNGALYTPVFNMEGGKLYNKGTDAVRMFLNSTSNLNQVNVSGGIIDGSKDGRIVCIQDSNTYASKGEFNMTGGVVTKDVSGWSAANNEYTYTDAQYEQVRINISGGQMRAFLTTYMPKTAARAEALRVTGGTFEVDPSDYVADGYAATQTQNGWVVAEVQGEAQIDNQVYETIDAAITAVPTNGTTSTTVKLLKNTEGKDLLPVRDGRKVVLDLLGHNLTRRLDLYDGELTVKNGLVSANAYVNGDPVNTGVNTYYNTFTLAADATIQASDPKNAYSIILYQADNGTGYGSIVNIYGHIVNSTLWVLGNIHAGNSVINVKNGAVIDGGETRGGVAVNGVATLNIEEGATVIGKTAVEVRAGNLNVTGGTIRGTISPGSVKPNGSGTTTEGAGIAISQHTTKLPISAAISGGTIEGHTGLYLINPENNTAAEMATVSVSISGGTFRAINDGFNAVAKDGTNIESATLSITGGSFSSDPTLYVADGYGAIYTSGTCPYQVTNLNWANYAASDADFTAATNGTTISINSAALLAKFAKNVNSGVTYNGYTIELTADIDLAGKIWTPIGIAEYLEGQKPHKKTFEGTFDGKEHTISNLNCSSNKDKPQGLFGVTYGGPSSIKNLNMSNVNVSGVHQAGAIIGNSNNANISNCNVNGGRVVIVPRWTSSGYDDGNQAGGIAGYMFAVDWHSNGYISNCSVRNLTVKAYRDVGGIVGAMQNSKDHDSNPEVGAVYVQNNVVENTTIIADQTCPYKEVKDYNAGQIVGRFISGTAEGNNATSVTVVTKPYTN